MSYDEPKILSSQLNQFCLIGVDGGHAKEKALVELIAPKVGGVTASDGSWIEAQHMIDGGPSVLFDAVAVLASRPRSRIS